MKGRLVLDCSTLLPGPFMAKLLAQQGARVVKIENPDRPDPARTLNPAYYADLNDCKELVKLNLTVEADRAKFRKLVAQADGLIEGFRPAAKKKLGLDEASLHAANPRICILSLVGYPEDGPWRDRAGHDLNFEALTGLLSLFKEMPAIPLADFFGSFEGALSLACAMDETSRNGGKGRRIVISLMETLLRIQSRLIREYRETGNPPRPGETLFSGLFPCYRVYTAGDGRKISVGAIEEKFWQEICSLIGVPELAAHGYATGEKSAETAERIQRAFSSRPWKSVPGKHGWDTVFAAADCCVEPVLDYTEVFGAG